MIDEHFIPPPNSTAAELESGQLLQDLWYSIFFVSVLRIEFYL